MEKLVDMLIAGRVRGQKIIISSLKESFVAPGPEIASFARGCVDADARMEQKCGMGLAGSYCSGIGISGRSRSKDFR